LLAVGKGETKAFGLALPHGAADDRLRVFKIEVPVHTRKYSLIRKV
jgi:mannitol/fructose-specific phosphotransferase system IIA component